jgi:hypothetical protein
VFVVYHTTPAIASTKLMSLHKMTLDESQKPHKMTLDESQKPHKMTLGKS